tara:strand:- start:25 stop:1302 length:1278 start_codon:yes stop_codon:yes gene_type:complete
MSIMNRRDFAKSLAVTGGALSAGTLSALEAAPTDMFTGSVPSDAKTSDKGLLHLTKSILKQNLLKAGEFCVVATGYIYPADYVAAMIQSGQELGALMVHVPVFPNEGKDGRLTPGLTMDHWHLYATADLLVDVSFNKPGGVPGGTSGYGGKIGDHDYPTDRAIIHRVGSKTRWLGIHFDVPLQRTLFANQARRARSIYGAELLHNASEVRIESDAGSDIWFGKKGKQGHSQYGIADVPGRWDMICTAVVATASNKDEAEGVLVFEPGDVLLQMTPQVLPQGEEIKITFRGGEIVNVEGTRAARFWDELLSSYGHPDSKRVAHVGFGTHEKTRHLRLEGERTPRAVYAYHHNDSGSFLFALGNNCGHGGGGRELNYSGLGMNADACGPNHTHFSFHAPGRRMWFDDKLVVDDGELVDEIASLTTWP